MSKSAYIKLFAGLGNQLFQYAYGEYLKTSGARVRYILSPAKNGAGEYQDLPFVFKVDKSNICVSESKALLSLLKIYAKYIRRSYNAGFYQRFEYAKESGAEKLDFIRKSEYMNTSAYKRISASENSAAVHIRGGDYLSNEPNMFSGVCTARYYKNSINAVKASAPDADFFFFTNDADYARKIMSELDMEDAQIIKDAAFANDPGYELFLMSACAHNVIANSTYSWWSAFLNKNKNKIVCAPARWFNLEYMSGEKNDIIEQIIPPQWKKIHG